jgi:hypothetical protein
VQQHLVSLLERVLERDSFADYGKESLVRHHDHRVDVLPHLGDAELGLTHALAAFEQERLGDDTDCQGTSCASELAQDGCGTGSSPTTHAAGHEDEVGVVHGTRDFFPVLVDGLLPDLRPRTSAKAASKLLTYLDFYV